MDPSTAAPGGASFVELTHTRSSHYRELEATVHYTLREHDQVSASYIWNRARGDLNSLSDVAIPFAAPVIGPNVCGILPRMFRIVPLRGAFLLCLVNSRRVLSQ